MAADSGEHTDHGLDKGRIEEAIGAEVRSLRNRFEMTLKDLTEVTGLHREQYQVIGDEFVGVLDRLRVLIEQDLKALQELADEVGAPWTSGRLPVWSGVRIVSCPMKP